MEPTNCVHHFMKTLTFNNSARILSFATQFGMHVLHVKDYVTAQIAGQMVKTSQSY